MSSLLRLVWCDLHQGKWWTIPSGMANKPQTSKSQSQSHKLPTVSNTPNVMRSSQQMSILLILPSHRHTGRYSIEASLDILKFFFCFEAAHYRLSTIKTILTRLLLESTTQTTQSTNSPMSPALEADLIVASRKKISSIQERSEKLKTSRKESISTIQIRTKIFLGPLEQLENLQNPDSFISNFYKVKIIQWIRDMDIIHLYRWIIQDYTLMNNKFKLLLILYVRLNSALWASFKRTLAVSKERIRREMKITMDGTFGEQQLTK